MDSASAQKTEAPGGVAESRKAERPPPGVSLLRAVADLFLALAMFDFTMERRRWRERAAARAAAR